LNVARAKSIRRLSRVALRLGAAAAVLIACAAPARAADALLYRIFLRDGSTLISYGDYARVADRVVFSIPIGGLDTPSPSLHLVSIAESSVDWDRTDKYAQATRARHYAETRGEADFDILSNNVARALNDVATLKDPSRRLAVANQVSRWLADWPAQHYGYRASDVAQLSALLDEAVAELRAAAGQTRFNLSLVANSAPLPDPVPALPLPTLRESIEQAFTAARVSPDPAQRVALLETILAELKRAGGDATLSVWSAPLVAKASADLATEGRIDRKYRELVNRMVTAADARAKLADVTAIQALIKSTLQEDDRLGRMRPETTAALLATLDARLDGARRLRLARDAWLLRQRAIVNYERRIDPVLEQFQRSLAGLEQIRQLAGPPPKTLQPLAARVSDAWRDLKVLTPPAEATNVHGLLVSALQMAIRAVTSRRLAVTSGTDMSTAWEASSAAAGALLMFDKAREELKKLNTPPEL
jgi:hypothetical protein